MNRTPLLASTLQREPSSRIYERMAARHLARSQKPDELYLDLLYQCQYNHVLISRGVGALENERIYTERHLAKAQSGFTHGHDPDNFNAEVVALESLYHALQQRAHAFGPHAPAKQTSRPGAFVWTPSMRPDETNPPHSRPETWGEAVARVEQHLSALYALRRRHQREITELRRRLTVIEHMLCVAILSSQQPPISVRPRP